MSMQAVADTLYMHHALRIGERGLGQCWPNPSVGCVIVLNDHIIAAARTGAFGRPHAETLALSHIQASPLSSALGATAYVTLEPCAHQGQTAPCAKALIDAGITRVVIAVQDPDPRVAGKGIAMLKAANIEVTTGVLEEEAQLQHRGFFKRIAHKLPFTALKIATSLDGAIADSQGNSQWITDTVARAHAHRIRAQYDAILTGIGSVLADDPMLTCRLPGMEEFSPVRVVLDTHLRLPLDAQLVKTAGLFPTWVMTTTLAVEQRASHAQELRELGVTLITHDSIERISPFSALALLAEAGVTRVLVEAGAALCTSFMETALIDRIYWYRAPILLQGGKAALASHQPIHLTLAARYKHQSRIALYSDTLDVYDAATR